MSEKTTEDTKEGDPPLSPDRTDHNIWLDQYDDRWEWRRKIRADPRICSADLRLSAS